MSRSPALGATSRARPAWPRPTMPSDVSAQARRSRRRARAVRLRARLRARKARRPHPARGFRQRLRRAGVRDDGADAGRASAEAALARGLALDDYVRFLSLNGALDLDWGVRSEFEQKAQATVLERYGRDMIGFVGGRDAKGNVQFPKSRDSRAPGRRRARADGRTCGSPTIARASSPSPPTGSTTRPIRRSGSASRSSTMARA